MSEQAEISLSNYLKYVDKIVEKASEAKDGQIAQQFAQAAVSVMQATHNRFNLIGSGHTYSFKENDVIRLSHFTDAAKERIRKLVNEYDNGREKL